MFAMSIHFNISINHNLWAHSRSPKILSIALAYNQMSGLPITESVNVAHLLWHTECITVKNSGSFQPFHGELAPVILAVWYFSSRLTLYTISSEPCPRNCPPSTWNDINFDHWASTKVHPYYLGDEETGYNFIHLWGYRELLQDQTIT